MVGNTKTTMYLLAASEAQTAAGNAKTSATSTTHSGNVRHSSAALEGNTAFLNASFL